MKVRNALPILAMVVAMQFYSTAFAQETDETEAQFIQSILSHVSQVTTISSDFIQERRFSILRNMNVAKGHFYYEKPDRLRWEQREPAAAGFVVNGTRLKRWKGEKGRVQITELSREPAFGLFVGQIFAWCMGDADWLSKRYEIKVMSRRPPVIRLIPKEKAEKRHVNHITVEFSDDRGRVQSVDVETADKDSVKTIFANTIINSVLEKDIF